MDQPQEVLHFLMPLETQVATKVFEFKDEKWGLKTSYKAGKFFKGFETPVNNLKDVYEILKENQEHPVFFIHGGFIEGTNLNKMVRRKRTDGKDGLSPTIEDRAVTCICFDIDGYKVPPGGSELTFINEKLPEAFRNADCICQYSASAGLTTKEGELKCHLFFWLDKPVHNMDLKAWSKAFNREQDWGNIIDDSVFTCTQPIYTQKRLIEGAEDPIPSDLFLKHIKKKGTLKWQPSNIENSGLSIPLKSNPNRVRKEPYDLTAGVEKILTNENYHEELNKLALSLINKRVPPRTVQGILEGAMNTAKRGLDKDDPRLIDWQTRFDDIGRSIQTAADIVDNPTYEEVLGWVESTHHSVVQQDFALKVINLDPIDLRNMIEVIDKKLGVGKQAIKATINLAKVEQQSEIIKIAKEMEKKARESRGVTEIVITNDNHGSVTKQVADILANSEKEPQVFKLGVDLCIIDDDTPKTVEQIISKSSLKDDYPTMPIVKDITKRVGVLRARIEKDCFFINESEKPILCPDSILQAVPGMYGANWNPLSGVVEHPFIDDNWKLIQKSGYDKKTGLFTTLHHKLTLTRMDPLDSYNYLCDEVFAEFPFQSDLDKIIAVAALMTAIQRPYVSGDVGFPGFGITSPTQSSGKTTLAQLINYSIYNRPAAATSWSSNDEELGKHLLAILREGHSCVLFDNIQQGSTIQSNELAMAMTNSVYSKRKLGDNVTEKVPASVIWIFTGNNIQFTGDFATRILPINIVPDIEKPETRRFKRDNIGEWARNNRKEIISAVLSLVMAGKGVNIKESNDGTRFKNWDKFVRQPLLKVCGHDICKGFEHNNAYDEETMARKNLLSILNQIFSENEFKTRDMLDVCGGISSPNASFNDDGKILKDALMDAFGEKAMHSSKAIGRHMLGMRDKIFGIYTLVKTKKQQGVHWKINVRKKEKDNGIK